MLKSNNSHEMQLLYEPSRKWICVHACWLVLVAAAVAWVYSFFLGKNVTGYDLTASMLVLAPAATILVDWLRRGIRIFADIFSIKRSGGALHFIVLPQLIVKFYTKTTLPNEEPPRFA